MIKTGKYRHYKGKNYEVIDVAIHSETQELQVVYRPMYGEAKLWVRPLDMFQEYIDINGEKVLRFEYINDLETSY